MCLGSEPNKESLVCHGATHTVNLGTPEVEAGGSLGVKDSPVCIASPGQSGPHSESL